MAAFFARFRGGVADAALDAAALEAFASFASWRRSDLASIRDQSSGGTPTDESDE